MDYNLVDNEAFSINFQGIELKDMDDDQPKKNLYAPLSINVFRELYKGFALQEYELFSDHGVPFHVFAPKGRSHPNAIITVHDIGMNHESFQGFFNNDVMRVIMQRFSVYHICLPGHHDHAGTLANEITYDLDLPRGAIREEKDSLLPGGSDEGIYTISGTTHAQPVGKRTSFTYPTMDQLADIVEGTVNHFGLKCVIAFGVGAGSNVLARYALKSPTSLLGLFLINPCDTTHSYFPWIKAKMTYVPQLQKGYVSDGLMSLLENHWFGAVGTENMDLVERCHHDMRKLNAHNIAGYIMSYLNRTDLGLVRELDPAKKAYTRCIEIDSALVSGDRAPDLSRAMTDMNGRMDPAKTQFMSVTNCTGMVIEEAPEKLSIIFLNFLRNLGLVINLTPEKAQEEALRLRSELALMDAQNQVVEEAASGDQAKQGIC